MNLKWAIPIFGMFEAIDDYFRKGINGIVLGVILACQFLMLCLILYGVPLIILTTE